MSSQTHKSVLDCKSDLGPMASKFRLSAFSALSSERKNAKIEIFNHFKTIRSRFSKQAQLRRKRIKKTRARAKHPRIKGEGKGLIYYSILKKSLLMSVHSFDQFNPVPSLPQKRGKYYNLRELIKK